MSDRRGFLRLGLRLAPAPAAVDPFDAELERLRRVDPGLIGYDEVDRLVLDVDRPRGLASGAYGRVWVVGDRALLLFVAGRERRRVALPEPATCVCESGDGERVYVGLGSRLEVRRVDGAPLGAWRDRGEDALVTSVAATERVVFVADAGQRVVDRCDTHGRLLGRLAATRDEPRHFVVPSPFLDLALTREGILWATNPGRHRLESYTLEGEAIAAFGSSGAAIDGFCGCCNPTHVAALPGGRLVTSEKGLPRVKVLDGSGRLEAVVADGTRLAASASGLDLAVDEQQRVLVLDPRARAVRVFAPRGAGVAGSNDADDVRAPSRSRSPEGLDE